MTSWDLKNSKFLYKNIHLDFFVILVKKKIVKMFLVPLEAPELSPISHCSMMLCVEVKYKKSVCHTPNEWAMWSCNAKYFEWSIRLKSTM